MTKMIRIDSRVTGFSDQPVRLMAMCFHDTEEILLQKTEIFTALAVPPDLRSSTVVVTDSPGLIKSWQLKFDAQQHLEEVIRIYQASYRAGLVEFEDSIKRYNPMMACSRSLTVVHWIMATLLRFWRFGPARR